MPEIPQPASMGNQSSSSPPQDENLGAQGGREQPRVGALPRQLGSLGHESDGVGGGETASMLKASESLPRLANRQDEA